MCIFIIWMIIWGNQLHFSPQWSSHKSLKPISHQSLVQVTWSSLDLLGVSHIGQAFITLILDSTSIQILGWVIELLIRQPDVKKNNLLFLLVLFPKPKSPLRP